MSSRMNGQQQELKEYFLRAGRDPNKKGPARKEAFRRLLNLAQEPDSFSKKLVTEKVKEFFIDFPELQDEAINVVYDMCEDQDQEIRIAGFGAITSVSEVDRSWLLRNADVLVQLLQSDDSNEVAVVKRALTKHVDLDARSTLQVLCDQCVYKAEDLADEDERMLRSRLRTLVLQFLAEKYHVCVDRAVKDREVEEILLKGMVDAIPQASPSEVRTIVSEILSHLPSLTDGSSQNGITILETLLSAARNTLEAENPNSDRLSSLLSQAYHIVSLPTRTIPTGPAASRAPLRTLPTGDPIRLLKFFEDDALMQRVPLDAGEETFGYAYRASAAAQSGNKKASTRKLLDVLPTLLGLVTRYISSHSPSSSTYLHILTLFSDTYVQALISDPKEGYSPPSTLSPAVSALLAGISSKSSGADSRLASDEDTPMDGASEARKDALSAEANRVMVLSRDLIKALESRSRRNVLSKGSSSALTRGHSGLSNSVKQEQSPGSGPSTLADRLAPRIQPGSRPSENRGLAIRGTSSGQSVAMDVDEDELARAGKRRKARNGVGIISPKTSNNDAPSLLSRLGSASPAPNSNTSTIKFSQTQPNGGPTVRTALGNVKRSGSGDDAAHTDLRGSMRAASASRDHSGQTTPASVGVGRSNSMALALNGDIGNGNGMKVQTLRKDARRVSSTTEPMEISILGASGTTNDSDEIKIRGAAERRSGGDDDNESGARGLSLLARLGDGGLGGGSANDQGNGRKRKFPYRR